jgi:YHS domain-containing protein
MDGVVFQATNLRSTMKQNLIVSTIAALLISSAAIVMAAEKHKAGPSTRPSAATQAAKKPVNKFCAVEGKDHEIDPKVTVVYKGKVIGFCCRDCVEEFEKDPEKYVKRME